MVNAIVEITIKLSIESAIVGTVVSGFIEFMISGNEKIKAKIPNVSTNLLAGPSNEFSKIKMA